VSRPRVLIVDDEPDIRFGVRDYLEAKGYDVAEAGSCAEAWESFRARRPDLVLLDHRLGDCTAMELLPRLRRADPSVATVVLTGHATIDLAVQAMKEGAEQFLTKPIELAALTVVLERVLENQRNRSRQLAQRSRREQEAVDPFVGASRLLESLAAVARKVAPSDSPVLILGETGTGKGVLARWLHENGPRAEEAFVELNCAGLSSQLLDSELFGHEKGAFTSAVKEKQGLLEIASRGTLFLDEIGDMDLQVQAKLLKVLEEQRFRRVGEVRDRSVDVRLIAATHQDLPARVRDGAFRHDLFYRINTIQLTVPPLRERGDDILVLAGELMRRLQSDLGRGEPASLSAEAEAALRGYHWPGNVRELRNVLERALLLSDQPRITGSDLPFERSRQGEKATGSDGALTLREVERRHIVLVLGEVRGRVQEAAQRLGIPRSTLYQKLRSMGLEPADYRGN
jgi:DNA-binding NtrC family response regulator